MDEICSVQPKNMHSKYLSVVRSVYQLQESKGVPTMEVSERRLINKSQIELKGLHVNMRKIQKWCIKGNLLDSEHQQAPNFMMLITYARDCIRSNRHNKLVNSSGTTRVALERIPSYTLRGDGIKIDHSNYVCTAHWGRRTVMKSNLSYPFSFIFCQGLCVGFETRLGDTYFKTLLFSFLPCLRLKIIVFSQNFMCKGNTK